MNTTAPTKGKIAWMILFAASCIGLLLFLWISFGGSVPLSPQGYRIVIQFPQATQLGTQADVDIAGVRIGTVVSVNLDKQTGLNRAVIQIDPKYAPRPINTRAILRTKTILGETYVALSFGNPNGRMLKDGATLPQAQVASTVDLDQILNTFSPKTRQAFKTWMQDDGMALSGRGQDFNTALASLQPFATNVSSVLAVLERDRSATRALLSNGSKVLHAVSENPQALQGLITNSNKVFAATASRNHELAEAVRNFPAFLRSTRVTVADVRQFSDTTMPLVNELLPAATPFSNALKSLSKLTPQLKTVFTGLGPLTAAADTGVPALEDILNVSGNPPKGSLKAVFPSITSWLGNIVPIVNYVNVYRRQIAAFFANGTAATQGTSAGIANEEQQLHVLRSSAVLNPDGLTNYSTSRAGDSRSNPYPTPSGYSPSALKNGLRLFASYLCSASSQTASIPSSASGWNDFPDEQKILNNAVYGGEGADASKVPAPVCKSQGALASKTIPNTGGLSQTFPNLKPLK
jgi:phospholipid/cholesterol/gamma-HCH transport system substrate-binding protein